MKHFLFLGLVALMMSQPAMAQNAAKTVKLQKKLTLKPASYESGNGAAVLWHPILKRYYTARAGNVVYPLDIYDATGKVVASGDSVETQFDIRGMWYNPMTKRICMNGYNDAGWASYVLNSRGIPTGVTTIKEGMNQPDEQSVGAFDGKKSSVYFLSGTSIFAYNANNATLVNEKEILNLRKGICAAYKLDIQESNETLPDFYNPALMFTGMKDQEYALLNATDKQIDLYSGATGMRTKVLLLPEGTETYSMLNFGYTNGMYFLYDKESKEWRGYK